MLRERWVFVLAVLIGTACGRISNREVAFCPGEAACPGRNPAIAHIRILQQYGSRPRFSPSGANIVFDRKNDDGFYDVYLTDLEGAWLTALTDGRPGVAQRNNGNATFHPDGSYIIFVSEAEEHFGDSLRSLGDSGVGLFSNLWVTDLRGERFWRLTDIPIKHSLLDGVVSMAAVNPLFSPDGRTLLWTERYAPGGHHNWGLWRIKAADFVVGADGPSLENERPLFTHGTGTYVTAMDFLDATTLILAGNLDGQHEYGMDQYRFDLPTGEWVNLTDTPEVWEEDASVTPSGRIVLMTNAFSTYAFDFDDPNWPAQPMERDYVIMEGDGSQPSRLTYFNDPATPEYTGRRVLVAASDVSPDGRLLAATLGFDFGGRRRNVVLKVALIEFVSPQ